MPAIAGRKPKVALTRGHNPDTPGKRSFDSTLLEWAFNDDMALRVYKHLAFNGIDAKLTVPTGGHDPYPDTNTTNMYKNRKDRITRINAWGPDLEIEFHANAAGSTWNTGRGQIIYLAASKKGTASEQFVNVLRKYMRTIAGTGTVTRDRGIGYKNFDIVYGVKAPCCLIEHAFMTNKDDKALLLSPAQRDKWAEATARAVCEWFTISFKDYRTAAPAATPAPAPAPKPATPTPASAPAPAKPKMPTLKRGMLNNADVRKLQNLLNHSNTKPEKALDEDGDFGELTENALKAWQKANKVSSPAGVADQATWDKLLP